MLFSEQLNYYPTIEKVFQVLQYFTKAVILRRARSFCGALFKRILKRGISKRQFIEIVPLLVIFHLPYNKYKGVKMFLLVPLSKSDFFTRVVRVALVSHLCRLVSLVSLVSGTRVANQTRSSRILGIMNAKFSGYCFYMSTKIQGDFQICI